jgi:hypothetical protein
MSEEEETRDTNKTQEKGNLYHLISNKNHNSIHKKNESYH